MNLVEELFSSASVSVKTVSLKGGKKLMCNMNLNMYELTLVSKETFVTSIH